MGNAGPDHGNSLVLENYHAARSHGPSDYVYDLLRFRAASAADFHARYLDAGTRLALPAPHP